MISTFFAFVFGWDFDPNDYPGSYYRAEIPKRQWVMVISLLIPAMSLVAAVQAIFTRPHERFGLAASVTVLVLALPVLWFCWVIGIESILNAAHFAERFSG